MKISSNVRVRKMLMVFLTIQMTLSMAMVTFAANYTENAGKWVLDQAFWVVIVVTVLVAIGAWMKHATTAIIMTVIVGGALAFFCKSPELIVEVGSTLAQAIFGS